MNRNHAAIILALSAATAANANPVYTQDFESEFSEAINPEWSDHKLTTLGGSYSTFLGNFGSQTVSLSFNNTDTGSGGEPGGEPGGGEPGADSPGNVYVPVNSPRANRAPRNAAGKKRTRDRGGLVTSVRPFQGNFIPETGTGGSEGGGGEGGGGDGGGANPGGPSLNPGIYTLVFDLMLFDTWDGLDPVYGTDRFQIDVNGQRLFDQPLETFELNENYRFPDESSYTSFNSSFRDIVFRGLSVSFTLDDDQPFSIDFIGATNQPLYDESWGIDNVQIFAGPRAARGALVPAPASTSALAALALFASRRRR